MQQAGFILAAIVAGLGGSAGSMGWTAMQASARTVPMSQSQLAEDTPVGRTASTSAQTVVAYYQNINKRRFADAYAMLTPAARSRTTFRAFEDGYLTTKSVSAKVDPGNAPTVSTTLSAVDRTQNGDLTRTFVGAMKLVPHGVSWSIDDSHFELASSNVSSPSHIDAGRGSAHDSSGDAPRKSTAQMVYDVDAILAPAKAWALDNAPRDMSENNDLMTCFGKSALDYTKEDVETCNLIGHATAGRGKQAHGTQRLAIAYLADSILSRTCLVDSVLSGGNSDVLASRCRQLAVSRMQELKDEAQELNVAPMLLYASTSLKAYRGNL